MSHMPTTNSPASSSSLPSVSLINSSGGTVLVGAAVYSSAAGSFNSGSAGSFAAASIIGLIMQTTLVGVSGLIQTNSVYTTDTASWDAIAGTAGGLAFGQYYWLSTTPGHITSSPPTGSGQFVALIGFALSATQMRLMIQPPIGL